MKVILLKDVKGVGRRYEEKEVSEGYAINFLIPKKFAVPRTGAEASRIKNLKENEEKHKNSEHKKLETEVQKLANTDINLSLKANEKGHLFAKLTKDKIVQILKEKGFDLPEESIDLERSIQEVGTHSIQIKKGGKLTHFNLVINN